jgi:hypothetical protein
MRTEPRLPKDGRCVVCGKVITTDNRYGEVDAFCSAVCCRDYYGTSLAPPEKGRPVSASS